MFSFFSFGLVRFVLPTRFCQPLRALSSKINCSELNGCWHVPGQSIGKRFVVRADEKLAAFLELESAIHARAELS